MKRLSFPDSTAAEIDDVGRWDLTFPNGKHVRGHAATVDDAEKQIKSEHDRFVLSQWEKGQLVGTGKGTVWGCPIK